MNDRIAHIPSLMDGLSERLPALAPAGASAPANLEWMILTNGDSDPFDSIILLGFESSGVEPLYAAKVPRMPGNGRLLQVEYERLKELWSLMGPDAARTLPEPIAFMSLGVQPILVLSYVSGPTLLKAAGRRFWGQQEQVLELAKDAARSLRGLHERACVPLDPAGSVPPGFDFLAGKFRALFSLSSAEELALQQIAEQLSFETSKASHKVLIQGDFWHGNLIRSPETGNLVFIDWQYARWSADVSMDVYLFPLAAAFTAAPYGSAAERARGAARILADWRIRIIPAYLEAYGQPEKYALLPEWQGMLAACVEKAVRPALEYGYSHPDDLMWRYLFAELLHWSEANPAEHQHLERPA